MGCHCPILPILRTCALFFSLVVLAGTGDSSWTVLILLYLMIFSKVKEAKFAPRGTVLLFEVFTVVFWLVAAIALALFAVEIELICYAADIISRSGVLKKAVEVCVLTKVITACAAASWLIWCITLIIVSVQGCRSKKTKKKALPPPMPGYNVYGAGSQGYEMVGRSDLGEAEKGVRVTTVPVATR
ncbi:uncharacterized protein KY384_002692 [Bacidia gigantensis]|uniref:uncharacterized protein n=1 Tax=Bacidia gigantensis TaxID=2732470 RepID=UPI001D049596|nr:uncharacterized protein KY384_002692 [Bacidia gigantensis]KAG8532814.1 hypothetical protein KY384_002692 [Bacidia gigantensis]